MPFNGNGVYVAPSSPGAFNPAVSGQQATPDAWNALLLDLQTALSTAICRDGQSTITADIPFAGFKLTHVGHGVAGTDAANVAQVQTGATTYGGADVGAADAYEVTLSPAPAAYVVGQSIDWEVGNSNATTTPTLKLTGLMAGVIEWPDGSALDVDSLPAGANVRTIVSAVAVGVPTWQLETVASPFSENKPLTLTQTLTMSAAAINEAKGANIASATTTDIGAATGNYVHVTGTTTITGLGTVQAGVRRKVVFDGALILTYDATKLILPTAANITTAAGDCAEFESDGTGNWHCTDYLRASGTPLAMATGTLVNRAYVEDAAFTTITANIPIDDTIPQVTEGTEILSVAITPQKTTDRIRARAVVPLGLPSGASGVGCVALFRNGGANAISSIFPRLVDGFGNYSTVLEFEDSPGSVSAQTYSIRVGGGSFNVLLNGDISGRLGGGSSRATLILEEIVA